MSALDREVDPFPALLSDLVIANRVLAREGVQDGFGHVSVRHPRNPQHYFLPRSRSPELVSLDDLMEFELDGQPINAQGQPMYVERAIHGAIYEARPEVMAICHNHARSVIPFSVTKRPLRPLTQVTAVIGAEVPVWDIRTEFGTTDLLIRTREQGLSLARAMKGGRTLLMRGHGCVVAAGSLADVVFTAIYLDVNAQMQKDAEALGEVNFLTADEVAAATKTHSVPSIVGRTWEYWRNRAGFEGI